MREVTDVDSSIQNSWNMGIFLLRGFCIISSTVPKSVLKRAVNLQKLGNCSALKVKVCWVSLTLVIGHCLRISSAVSGEYRRAAGITWH